MPPPFAPSARSARTARPPAAGAIAACGPARAPCQDVVQAGPRSRPSRRARPAPPPPRRRRRVAERVARARAPARRRRRPAPARRARGGEPRPGCRRPRVATTRRPAGQRLQQHVGRALVVAGQRQDVAGAHPDRHLGQRPRRPRTAPGRPAVAGALPAAARALPSPTTTSDGVGVRGGQLLEGGGQIQRALVGLDAPDEQRSTCASSPACPSSARAAARSRGWNSAPSTPLVTMSMRSGGTPERLGRLAQRPADRDDARRARQRPGAAAAAAPAASPARPCPSRAASPPSARPAPAPAPPPPRRRDRPRTPAARRTARAAAAPAGSTDAAYSAADSAWPEARQVQHARVGHREAVDRSRARGTLARRPAPATSAPTRPAPGNQGMVASTSTSQRRPQRGDLLAVERRRQRLDRVREDLGDHQDAQARSATERRPCRLGAAGDPPAAACRW